MTEPNNTSESAPKRTPLWLKILGVGCAGVIVIVLIVGGLVAANWSKVTGYYHQAKSMVSDLMTVRTALQAKYGGDVRITAKSVGGVEGAILSITLVNPALMDRVNVDSVEGRQAALEVAAAARDALPPDRGYDNYEVVFQRERGAAGVSTSGNWSFRFKASDLPQAAAR